MKGRKKVGKVGVGGGKEKEEPETGTVDALKKDGFDKSVLIFRFRCVCIFNDIKVTLIPLLLYGALPRYSN